MPSLALCFKKCWLLVSEISMKLDVIIGVHHGDVVVSTVK
jgi:hypothetical protein